MLQRADIAGARPVVLIEATTPSSASGDASQELFDRLSQLLLGQELQGQVLSRLTDGTYLVKIQDAVAAMKLPPGTRTGETLDLTLVSTNPRPTFLLGKPDSGATASLSNAGRLIADVLRMASESGAPPAAVIGKAPLLATPDTPAEQIATALQNAVSASGVFYEAHVAQWAEGNRPLAELLNEPQAALPGSRPPSAAVPAAPRDAGRTAQAPPAGQEDKLVVASLLRRMADETQAASAKAPGSDADAADAGRVVGSQDAVITPDAARLLNLQLDVLEQQRIVWQGELFPGQPIEWEIADETAGRKGGGGSESGNQGAPAERTWQSTVRFSLPTLGGLSATVRLTGDHVQVDVSAASERTATVLKTYAGMLAEALDAAGTKLDSLLVRHDG